MKFVIFSLKFAWLSISFVILYLSDSRISDLNSMKDISSLIAYTGLGMLIISLPIGLVSFILIIIISFIFDFFNVILIDGFIINKHMTLLAVWFVFFILGGWQWFILIPNLLNKK